MNERDVRHDRHLPAERLIDLGLAGAVVEVIVTADDVGDAHIVVVDNDGEHVSGRAVRTQQDEVIEIFVLPDDASLHLIFDGSFSGERRLEPDHRIRLPRARHSDHVRGSGRYRGACGLPPGPSRASR